MSPHFDFVCSCSHLQSPTKTSKSCWSPPTQVTYPRSCSSTRQEGRMKRRREVCRDTLRACCTSQREGVSTQGAKTSRLMVGGWIQISIISTPEPVLVLGRWRGGINDIVLIPQQHSAGCQPAPVPLRIGRPLLSLACIPHFLCVALSGCRHVTLERWE